MAKEYTEDCVSLHKKLDNLRITARKKDEKIIRQSAEITSLLFSKEQTKKFIQMQERHMKIQDGAIERKDEQMEALKKLYCDDLINGRI